MCVSITAAGPVPLALPLPLALALVLRAPLSLPRPLPALSRQAHLRRQHGQPDATPFSASSFHQLLGRVVSLGGVERSWVGARRARALLARPASSRAACLPERPPPLYAVFIAGHRWPA